MIEPSYTNYNKLLSLLKLFRFFTKNNGDCYWKFIMNIYNTEINYAL